MSRFEGDPKITIGPDGWTLTFKGGQPEMDQGLENMATIALMTKEGWVGNIFLEPDEQIGSDLRKIASGSITINSLNDIRQSAEKALKNPAFGKITPTVRNPISQNIFLETLIQPPGRDVEKLILTKNGQNWINQAIDPAFRRV